jgi:hypothetical protein
MVRLVFLLCGSVVCQDIQQHECGEYALEQLQLGRSAAEVVDLLLERYMVKTTYQRVVAYRYYREQRSEYWTLEKIEASHWAFLYEQVPPEGIGGLAMGRLSIARTRKLEAIRSGLCAQERIAEELVPVHVLQTFYVVHEAHAKRALRYADATVVRDALPSRVVEAYRVAWGGAVTSLKLVYCSGALGFLGRVGGLGFLFFVC